MSPDNEPLLMPEPDFITRANARLEAARNLASSNLCGPTARRELLALILVAEHAVTAVGSEGSLPSHLCTAVVKYGVKP